MKHLFTCLLCILFFTTAQAQYWEVGAQMGVTNYKGDLNDGKINHKEHNIAMGLIARYNVSPKLALRGTLMRGELSGSDYSSRTEALRLRNLNFRSEIIEVGVQGEFNLMNYHIPNHEISTPYIFGGVSLFHFNPQAEYNGQWIDLQPLGTEGQVMDSEMYGEPYKRWQMAIPLGLGFKFNFNKRVNLNFELGFRKTFTDYLDDVSGNYPDIATLKTSDPLAAKLAFRTPEYMGYNLENPEGLQRGNNKKTDSYLFAGVTISVNLTDKYGLDFDKKYDIFKEEYQEYVESQKLINQDKVRLKKRERRKRKKERLKRKKERLKELNKKKKAGWQRQQERKEKMQQNNVLHPDN